jgi:5-methyltetrahydropteroyltriglutamate--homocysteine methyltransferase
LSLYLDASVLVPTLVAEAATEVVEAYLDAAGQVRLISDFAAAEVGSGLHPEATIEDCRKWALTRVDALNHALRGLRQDRIRYHTCYSIRARLKKTAVCEN